MHISHTQERKLFAQSVMLFAVIKLNFGSDFFKIFEVALIGNLPLSQHFTIDCVVESASGNSDLHKNKKFGRENIQNNEKESNFWMK